jgi:hypothetical protein
MIIRIEKFAGFEDSEPFELREGLNVFVGINNSGKTALLWALSVLDKTIEKNRAWYRIQEEMLSGYLHTGVSPHITVAFSIPAAKRDDVLGKVWPQAPSTEYSDQKSTAAVFEFTWAVTNSIGFLPTVQCQFNPESGGTPECVRLLDIVENKQSYVFRPPFGPPLRSSDSSSEEFPLKPFGVDAANNRMFGFLETDQHLMKLWRCVPSDVVFIGAHRQPSSSPEVKMTTELAVDVSNLAQVLATAQWTTRDLPDGRDRFLELERDLRTVFPEIQRVRTQLRDQRNHVTPKAEIEIVLDLSNGKTVDLNHSGTGVQQVLALLAGIHFATVPTIFLIDEPHSYLHPAAERGIVRILEKIGKERRHILCLTTHSSLLASHARANLFAVRMTANGSKVRELRGVQEILGALGIEKADLFTYDKVLFVEGESDRQVLQLLFETHDQRGLQDRVKIVCLFGDGNFKKKKSALKQLKLLVDASTTEVKVPLGFLFDSNDWEEPQMKELQRVLNRPGSSSLGFLQKPELEDYLLHPGAIVHFLLKEAVACEISLDELSVNTMVLKIIESGSLKGSVTLQTCLDATMPGRPYKKAQDSPKLCSIILELDPNHMRPLFDELVLFIDAIGKAEGDSEKRLALATSASGGV